MGFHRSKTYPLHYHLHITHQTSEEVDVWKLKTANNVSGTKQGAATAKTSTHAARHVTNCCSLMEQESSTATTNFLASNTTGNLPPHQTSEKERDLYR